MARIVVAPALARWLPGAQTDAGGRLSLSADADTVATALDAVFAVHPRLRGYVLDEHGAVRHHVAVVIDGEAVRDKRVLAQALRADSEIHLLQALSGG